MPLKPSPVPLVLTELTVTLSPLLLVSVSVAEPVCPTVTVPKETLVGFAARVPAVTPVP